MNNDSFNWREELTKLRQEKEDLVQAVEYYKRLSDEVAGHNIRTDSSISLLKRSLKQKQDGFSILAAMHNVFVTRIEPDPFFNSILEWVNTLLQMDYSLVIWASDDTSTFFQPRWMLGLPRIKQDALRLCSIECNALPNEPILFNKKSTITPHIALLQEKLELRFFIGIPLHEEDRIKGWIFSGREKEAWPFYPPFNKDDLETFQAIGSFMEAGIANYRLYQNLAEANASLETYNRELEQRVEARTKDIQQRNQELALEKKKSDELLLNILPAETAEELKKHGRAKAKRFEGVTVMFTDFVNFTRFSELLSPEELVDEIHYCFCAFDEIITHYGIEKIKTIGDAYMCAGGLPVPGISPNIMVQAALDVRDFMNEYKKERQQKELPYLEIRIGLHQGSIVAGVVGMKKFSYDVWGDTVNIAARMEASSVPGRVNVSGIIFEACSTAFHFEYRGKIEAKNKGEIDMYFVEPLVEV